jgi:hypothetical protein
VEYAPYPDLAVKKKSFVIMTEVQLVREVGVQEFKIEEALRSV